MRRGYVSQPGAVTGCRYPQAMTERGQAEQYVNQRVRQHQTQPSEAV